MHVFHKIYETHETANKQKSLIINTLTSQYETFETAISSHFLILCSHIIT